MSLRTQIWMVACLLILGGLAFSGASVSAGDKKGGVILNKTGELRDDDEKDTKRTNSPRRIFTVKLAEGKSYQIDLKSKDFDSYLRLEDSTGKEVAFDDDGGGFPDAKITYKPAKSGDFKVIVTSFDGKGGNFALTVADAGGAGGGGGGGADSIFKGNVTKLEAKDGKARIEGELDANTPIVQQHYYRLYTFKFEEGKTYRIEHMSDDFDAFLFLEGPTGKKIAQDDDSGGGLNSRIIHKAATAGDYRIIATSLKNKETGKFVLQVSQASGDEEKEAAFNQRVQGIANAAPDEQKKIAAEFLKRLQDRGEKLAVTDLTAALQVTSALEEADIDLAKKTYADYIKIFAASDNAQIAKVAKANFESSLKKLDMIGKVIEISGKTVDGKEYDLKNMKGKVVLVDFWATWCGPCIAELPNMEAAYKKYHGKGFDIIGISLDRPGDDEKLSKFIENRKMPWPCITIEDSRPLATKYSVNAIPFPVLVDAQGRVVSLRARGPQLERLLERLLAEKK